LSSLCIISAVRHCILSSFQDCCAIFDFGMSSIFVLFLFSVIHVSKCFFCLSIYFLLHLLGILKMRFFVSCASFFCFEFVVRCLALKTCRLFTNVTVDEGCPQPGGSSRQTNSPQIVCNNGTYTSLLTADLLPSP